MNVSFIIKEGKEKLSGKDAARLAAIHAGITVAAALVITLLQYALSEGIGNTSGLSGLGTRSILETIQTALQWANMILMPFWNLGFLYAALQWARGNYARKEDLLTGFHRIGPCLSLLINRALIMISVMVICANISSIIYMMTPASAPIADLAAQAGTDMNALNQMLNEMTVEETGALLRSMIPMLVIWAALSALLLVPLVYRFRMAEYVILTQPGARGLSSMLMSAALMRRRCWQMFKLDLRLWWYYGLKVLCLLICYADLLLAAFGVALPLGGEMAYMVTYLVYLAALFCVQTLFAPRVETAYACAFEAMMEAGPVQRKQVERPQNMPWDEE